MTRTDDDSWDPGSGVGATATMVAAARALASREADAIIDDPFAEPLVRAAGIEFFTRLVEGGIDLSEIDDDGTAGLVIDVMAVRTRFFDDFFLDSAKDGVRQAVILASGLDSRAYRLPWPPGTTVFEIDQPKVIEFKTSTLAAVGASATAAHRTVSADLREDWPAALRASGFDDTAPTAWSAEGLLMYLPPQAQDRLFDDITAMSAPQSRLATEYHPDAGKGITDRARLMRERWGRYGFDLNMADLFYAGERNPVVDYLQQRHWSVTARPRTEMFELYGRRYPQGTLTDQLRGSLSVTAVRN